MEKECTHDCSSCASNCSERVREKNDFLETPHELSHIGKVIGVMSGKGGVGKSLVTSMLAVLARRRGKRVAILDADITGPSIPKSFGLRGHAVADETGLYPVLSATGVEVMSLNLLAENETDPVVWRGPVLAGAVKQFWTDVIWGEVDVMFIDMPPGTGDVPLTVFQSIPLNGVVVVATPQELVGMIVEKALNMANLMRVPVLGLVENMSYAVCPGCGKRFSLFGESRIDEAAARFHVKRVAKLPVDPRLAAAVDGGAIEAFEGDWLNDLLADIL
ncbi:MAG: Mrp/NBP35 family ATP-binding protein [Clostridiaceae bacterium]